MTFFPIFYHFKSRFLPRRKNLELLFFVCFPWEAVFVEWASKKLMSYDGRCCREKVEGGNERKQSICLEGNVGKNDLKWVAVVGNFNWLCIQMQVDAIGVPAHEGFIISREEKLRKKTQQLLVLRIVTSCGHLAFEINDQQCKLVANYASIRTEYVPINA